MIVCDVLKENNLMSQFPFSGKVYLIEIEVYEGKYHIVKVAIPFFREGLSNDDFVVPDVVRNEKGRNSLFPGRSI